MCSSVKILHFTSLRHLLQAVRYICFISISLVLGESIFSQIIIIL